MKKLMYCTLAIALIAGCSKEEHSHPEAAGPEPSAWTLYSDQTELFVEFTPLIAGSETKFAAHFTALGDSFKAITQGSVTLSLEGTQPLQEVTAGAPSSPGIFRLAVTPRTAGTVNLVFDIRTPAYTDRIRIDSIPVFADIATAISSQKEASGGGEEITYLKEQAWKIAFANMPVRRTPFATVIRTSGMILSAQGDEQTVPAKTSGTISFSGKNLLEGSPVLAGEGLFTVSSKGYTDNNADVKLQEAKSRLEKSRADFERSESLLKERLITQKEFLEAKVQYETAQAAWAGLSGNYSPSGQTIAAPLSGFIKTLLVTEGQYVEAGQPLAVISQNKRLVIRADISPTAMSSIRAITSANIKNATGKVWTLQEVNGRIASIGKSTGASLFIPVFLEIDNRGGLIPGMFTEVYLITDSVQSGLTVPVSALLEDQGSFYCYVQTAGESFEKRLLLTGGNDGTKVLVTSGLQEGERVVTRGAYNIKLSVASGSMPAHGHEH